jgi:uncharacterized protein YbjT (DUF2867 family)
MILVVGATGQLGGTIARRLMAGGQKVRVLVRPATDAGAYGAGICEVAHGDLRDRARSTPPRMGIATVVTTQTRRGGGGDTVDAVDLNGTRSLIDAAKAAGVQHFIYTSVLGVTPDSPVPFLAAKAQSEAHLRASGMAWTILAPNAFMESWPAMVVGMPAMAGKPVTIVERVAGSGSYRARRGEPAWRRDAPAAQPAHSHRWTRPLVARCGGHLRARARSSGGNPIGRARHAGSGIRRRAALSRRAQADTTSMRNPSPGSWCALTTLAEMRRRAGAGVGGDVGRACLGQSSPRCDGPS